MALAILVTPSFARVVKKLHSQEKAVLDAAVQAVASDPALGEEKRGDLSGVFVHKFKINKQDEGEQAGGIDKRLWRSLRLRPMQLQFAARLGFSAVKPCHGKQSET